MQVDDGDKWEIDGMVRVVICGGTNLRNSGDGGVE